MSSYLRQVAVLRAITSLVIAYAFALQMVLAGIVATQMAVANAADGIVICYSHDAAAPDEGGQPTKHTTHATCAICSIASSAAPLPGGSGLEVISLISTAAPLTSGAVLLHRADRHDPRTSQGPPQTV